MQAQIADLRLRALMFLSLMSLRTYVCALMFCALMFCALMFCALMSGLVPKRRFQCRNRSNKSTVETKIINLKAKKDMSRKFAFQLSIDIKLRSQK